MYSSIKKKKCKCGCGCYPTIGFAGYYHSHAPEYVKKAKQERMDRNIAIREKDKPNSVGVGKWFTKKRYEMKGVCCNCGKVTQKDNDLFFMWSIAHVLPKKIFDSVAQNDDNWIELCIDCHTLYDRNWLTASKMPVFKLAIKKFNLFKEQIADREVRHIPDCFLKT